MELFLLLSIGMSIVAFISIALNQAPPPQAVTDQSLELTFPIKSYLLSPEKMNMLKLDDEVILTDFEDADKNQGYTLTQRETSLLQKEGQSVLLEF